MARFLICENTPVAVDAEGYLKNLQDWNSQVAVALAQECRISLTEDHWQIIELVRTFYNEHQLSPPMRPLVNLVARELGNDQGRSIYLMRLFGGNAARTVNKIAGLPRPANCL